MYDPKPSKFAGYSSLPLKDTYEYVNNFREIIQGVCLSLLYTAAGTTRQSKYLGTAVKEMMEDPYLVRHRITGFAYDWKKKDLAAFKKLVAQGKGVGLWTLHSNEGANLGVAGEKFLIRINPEALPWLMRSFFTQNDLDLSSMSYASSDAPGWRQTHKADEYSVQLYQLCSDNKMAVKVGKDDELLFKDLRVKANPYKEAMEVLVRKYSFHELRSSEDTNKFIQDIFPNVSPDMITDQLFDYSLYTKKAEELETAEIELAKLMVKVDKLRTQQNLLAQYGGWEGLLERMGRDLESSLAQKAMSWVQGNEDIKEWRVGDLMKALSEAYIKGELQFPEE